MRRLLDLGGWGVYKGCMAEEAEVLSRAGKVPWHDTVWFKWVVMAVFALLIVGKSAHVLLVKNKGQDFAWHLSVGETVLNGTPYVNPEGKVVGDHYLPGRVLIDALPAILPLKGAQAVSLALMLAGMWAMVWMWGQMANGIRPATVGLHRGAVVLAFLLLAPWVVRDFDEAGLQFLLLAMLTVAGWCVYRGKQMAGGAWLALAITFKSTPLLFLPLLVYKRQWVAAGSTVLFVVVFNVMLPGIIWGPEKTQEAFGHWWARVREVSKGADPSENGVEPPKHQNQSLTFAMARYLQTYPPGHPLFIHEKFMDKQEPAVGDPALARPHWAFVQFLDLDKQTAKRVIMGMLGVIALGLAWRMRKRWAVKASRVQGPESSVQEEGRKTRALAPEWAVACAFAVLMSPLAWLHHLTLLLPCAYLVIRDLLQSGEERRRLRWAGVIVVAVCVWVLQRDPLPRQWAVLVMSYHEDVLACLILVVMALTVKEGGGTSCVLGPAPSVKEKS